MVRLSIDEDNNLGGEVKIDERNYYTREEIDSHPPYTNKQIKARAGEGNGKVTLIKYYKSSHWFCQCHCGRYFAATAHNVLSGRTKSCGCTRKEYTLKKGVEKTIELLKDSRPEFEVLTSSEKATDKWELRCKECNHVFKYAPSQLYGKRRRIPCKCSSSYRRSEEEWCAELTELASARGYQYLRHFKENYNTMVELYCPKHDHRWVTHSKHFLNGIGCNKCGEEITATKNKTITTESAVAEFKAAHGDRYDYSKVEYLKWDQKLTIVCPVHGDFNQRYKDHKKATYGCPSCARFGFKPEEPASLYVLVAEGKCKVGITNNTVHDRLLQINQKSTVKFTIHTEVNFTKGSEAKAHETKILRGLSIPFGDTEKYNGSTEVTHIDYLHQILEYLEERGLNGKAKEKG